MYLELPESVIKLQKRLGYKVYLVGGFVRNALVSLKNTDIDICGAFDAEEISGLLSKDEYAISSINNTTGTFVICDKKTKDKFEYTRFRRDVYDGGGHIPVAVEFVNDLESDARRRDFTINSIYCDVETGEIIDPLNGINDVKNKIIRTSDAPEKTFFGDGLRIMRMARFACQLGFEIEDKTIEAAKKYCCNLKEISAERIREELILILRADEKYPELTIGTFPHYKGLKILERIGFFDYWLKELYSGKGLAQRSDYHAFDVFEHSLRSVRYSSGKIRLAALLHDVGKPKDYYENGNMHLHDVIGAEMCTHILGQEGLKFPKDEVNRVKRLIGLHMADINCEMRENKVRMIIVENNDIIEDLLELKQADYLGCGLKTDICPTVAKWRRILNGMKSDGTPFSVKELAVSAREITERFPQIEKKYLSGILNGLLKAVVSEQIENTREILLRKALIVYKSLCVL